MTTTDPFDLQSERLGALPIVERFLRRMGLADLLDRHLPAGDARVSLSVATAIGVLVANLCVEREPLYGLADWAAGLEAGLVGLAPGEAALLNGDRVGRALDALFDSDRGSLLCELVLAAITEFSVDCSQLHNDSTSIVLHGDYAAADGSARAGKPTPALVPGHSKDHRPDLKQLVLILTVSADGAVPLTHRVADGNTNDDATHIDTWDGLVALTGRCDFLYLEFPRFDGHLMAEHAQSERMSTDAEDPAVHVGVQARGREVVARWRSDRAAAGARPWRFAGLAAVLGRPARRR